MGHSKEYNVMLFRTLDVNKDGVISFDEYRALVIPLGVSEEDCKFGFKMIDANGDGTLSPDEFAEACARYYFDKDDTNYKHLYGRYPENLGSEPASGGCECCECCTGGECLFS